MIILLQVSELLKLASTSYEDLKQFTVCVEEKLFRMPALRDRSLTYKTEEVQMTAVDEVYVEQNKSGTVLKQIARVRVFFISFLSGKLIRCHERFQSENDLTSIAIFK